MPIPQIISSTQHHYKYQTLITHFGIPYFGGEA